jgi:hypothetical protein
MIMGALLQELNNSCIIGHVALAGCGRGFKRRRRFKVLLKRMTAVAMNRIDRLMREMSLAEKLGQLTMTAADYAVTGPTMADDWRDAIRAGTVGNLLNLVGAGPVREMQR